MGENPRIKNLRANHFLLLLPTRFDGHHRSKSPSLQRASGLLPRVGYVRKRSVARRHIRDGAFNRRYRDAVVAVQTSLGAIRTGVASVVAAARDTHSQAQRIQDNHLHTREQTTSKAQ